MTRDEIYKAIDAERERQKELHGIQSWPSNNWLAILVEEVGEVAKEIQNLQTAKSREDWFEVEKRMKTELIQVLAVGVQWLEAR